MHWPLYAQRIVFAYNSVSHESIGNLSPFEMDFASPAKSAFGPPEPDLTFPDLEDPPTQEMSPVSPEVYIAALRVSVHAFHTFAATHKTFMAKNTQDRLNKYGIPHTFALNDRVKIYVPPTHAQLLRTGRRSNHIVAWRGPCRITKILSPTSYEMEEKGSGRTFQRTINNTRISNAENRSDSVSRLSAGECSNGAGTGIDFDRENRRRRGPSAPPKTRQPRIMISSPPLPSNPAPSSPFETTPPLPSTSPKSPSSPNRCSPSITWAPHTPPWTQPSSAFFGSLPTTGPF